MKLRMKIINVPTKYVWNIVYRFTIINMVVIWHIM